MSTSVKAGSGPFLGCFFATCVAVSGLTACGGSASSAGSTGPSAAGDPPPTVTLGATPSVIASGATSTIAWSSTNSTSCVSSGGGGIGTSGSFTTPSLFAATSYAVTCSGPGGSASETVTVNIGSGCLTTGATGVITLSNVPSRLTGVAPLSVFFDATGTTATTTTRPFHELEYTWSFGDPAGGATWANGARTSASKNAAKGPVTAHVFETPGTYYVSLSVTDGTNSVTNSCTQITVQDPDAVFSGTNTVCVAATSTPVAGSGGCPAGAAVAQQSSFPAAIAAHATTGKRVLFRRGDTFAAAAHAFVTSNGPGTIGAYGSGAAPLVQTNGYQILNFSSATTPTIGDWRAMDLEFDGTSVDTSWGICFGGGIKQVTILRLSIHDVDNGIQASDSLLNYMNNNGHPGHEMWDQIAVVDSTIRHVIGGAGSYGMYFSARRLSLLGNRFEDSTGGEHVTRFPFLAKAVIGNNTLGNPAIAKAVIKLHAPTWVDSVTPPSGVGSSGYSEQIVLTDNRLEASNNDWTVTLGPQNGISDERVRDVIVERNWFKSGVGSQTALVVMTNDATIRNNIFDMTGGFGFNPVYIQRWGAEPIPNNNRILNNTFYSNSSSAQFVGVRIASVIANTTVMNNLGYAPNVTAPVMISGSGTGLVQSNNSSDSQMKSASPLFAANPPVGAADFMPQGGSYAVNSGAAVPVYSDFAGVSRGGNTFDLGAYEQ